MPERGKQAGYTLAPFSAARRQQLDWLELMRRRHTMHALLEFDITAARRSLKSQAQTSRERCSFTAFLIWCVAQGVALHPELHAYPHGRGQLIIFHDVDVVAIIERRVAGKHIPTPHIIRAANKKALAQIHKELRAAMSAPTPQEQAAGCLPFWLLLPAWLRRAYWSWLLSEPQRRKHLMGTVAVSAVGMFGQGPGWGVPLSAYTLSITAGGVSRKPGLALDRRGPQEQPRVEVREYLSLTLSMDHDLIDGAPAARFAEDLRKLVEAGVDPGSA